MSQVVVKCGKLSWRLSQIVVSPSGRPLFAFADKAGMNNFVFVPPWAQKHSTYSTYSTFQQKEAFFSEPYIQHDSTYSTFQLKEAHGICRIHQTRVWRGFWAFFYKKKQKPYLYSVFVYMNTKIGQQKVANIFATFFSIFSFVLGNGF